MSHLYFLKFFSEPRSINLLVKCSGLTAASAFIAISAYSQYEAGEARLGDPGQLPRGGGCKAPLLQELIKNVLAATILLYSHRRGDEAAHLLACQLQGTDCETVTRTRSLHARYSFIHSFMFDLFIQSQLVYI